MNWEHILFMIEIYIIISLGANLVSGYTGLLSFANASFFGIGAYITSMLMKNFDFNFFLAMSSAMIGSSLISFVISYFSVKLKDVYFIVATIAFQIISFGVLYNWESVTEGSRGISEIPNVQFFGLQLLTSLDYALFGSLFLIITIACFRYFQTTPYLRVLESIRDRELGAISLGKNVSKYKFTVNAIASILIAISGSLFAVYNNYIDPTSFTLNESILIISMILIGGTGNLIGPIFGACFFVLLPEFIRFIPISSTQGASLQMMIYGLTLILMVRFKPNGFFGKYRFQ